MKKRTLNAAIQAATIRGLARMVDVEDRPIHTFKAGEINGWEPDALASYVIPIVCAAVKRHLTTQPRKKK